MIPAVFVELSLINFLSAFVSHHAHEPSAIFELSGELIAVLVLVNAAFFLPVKECAHIGLMILYVLQGSLLFLTFAP